jgi:hypothetical protein
MANIFFGFNYGEQDGYSPGGVTEGAASTATLDIEVRVATPTQNASGAYWYRSEVAQALRRLSDYVLDGTVTVFQDGPANET